MRKPRSLISIPEPGQGKRGEQGHLGYLLRQAGVAFRTRMEQALAEAGVTPPQFVVLTMVAAYPGLSNADLARLSLLTPQTISVIVGNLKKSRAVTSRPHAVHGRIQELDITEIGQQILDRGKPLVYALEQRLTADLPQQEQEIVRRWLVAVATH